MIAEVKVPEVGESISEGTLVQWFIAEGEVVQANAPLFELETDKVTLEVPAEHGGRLHILVPAGENVQVGQTVATLDTDAARAAAPTAGEPAAAEPPAPATQPPAVPQTEGPPMVPPAGFPQARAKLTEIQGDEAFSPAVRRMVEEFKVDPGTIPGTGRDGRITKEDVVRHLQSVPHEPSAPAPRPVPAPTAPPAQPAPAGGPPAAAPEITPPAVLPAPQPPTDRQTRIPMTPLRQRIAERLVLAQHSAAILTTFNEVDMSNLFAWREKHKQAFKERHGIGLGFMSFFVKASVDALKTVPQVNAQIQGDEIVQNHYYDIGVAISSDRGLVVPVLRDADRLSFAEVERQIAEMAVRVRDRKVTLGELTGGVFTISNGGVFGSLMSTPILNPPQSGILGMHAVKKRPMVVNDAIVIRPMMYLALSYDHRVVDGREAVTFLKRIVQCVEDPERMILEV